jgi:hypothetical protein
MNKELASILKSKIQNLPFIDKLAGLVQTVENVQFADGDPKNTPVRQKFPVSYDVTEDTCIGPEKDLIPDSSLKSITYFEDFGSKIVATRDGITEFNSQLRLICWLNRDKLTGNAYTEISAVCINSIIGKICRGHEDLGIFSRLHTKAISIPPQNSALFNQYTYDETVRQFLRPPFEFFGIDFLCNYFVPGQCLGTINFNNAINC